MEGQNEAGNARELRDIELHDMASRNAQPGLCLRLWWYNIKDRVFHHLLGRSLGGAVLRSLLQQAHEEDPQPHDPNRISSLVWTHASDAFHDPDPQGFLSFLEWGYKAAAGKDRADFVASFLGCCIA